LDYTANLGIPQTWYIYLRQQKHLPRARKKKNTAESGELLEDQNNI